MSKGKLFGRKSYLEFIRKRVIDLKDGYRQNIAIIGDELIGKTSIICDFLDSFYDNRFVTVYLEARPESLDSFVKRFVGAMLYNFLFYSGLPLKEEIGYLIEKSARYAPKSIERTRLILSSLKKRKRNTVFTELLSLCELMHQETGKHCVVIIDEFHNLENTGTKDLYRQWAKLLLLQKNTMYIITSSSKHRSQQILAKSLSLLFGNFQVVTVESFDVKTSSDFLMFKLGHLNLPPGLLNFLIHFTGGQPIYLKVIAEALLGARQKSLTDILEYMLFDTAGMLNQRFSNYLKRFLDLTASQDYISILYLIASGNNKIRDISTILHQAKKEIDAKARCLQESDTVTRNGDFLKINDRVFAFWLRFVYQEKLRSLTFDAKNQKNTFRASIDSSLQEFFLSTERPLVDRIAELMHLFKDEKVQIERYKLRLNRFREIKTLQFSRKGLRQGLLGRSHDSLWIMALKPDHLTEEDITDFSKECKKYRAKTQRKVIVTLGEIETNARLRALEEKIIAWDLNQVNQVLDLFYKPRVIA